jgi:hypothetical protein
LCPFLDKGVAVSKSVLLLSSALGAVLLSGPAFAGDKVRPGEVDKNQPKPAAVAGSPNTGEYTLINLTATDIAAANAGAGVLVGVYDGLTDCRHTELTGRCTNTQIPGGRYRFYDDHGTHVAGTVAGKDHGVAGRASIANYGVFDDRRYVAGGTYLVDAWNNAASRGASVASMSFGCTGLALCFTAAEVQAMAGGGLSGTLFVKAAGNDGVTLANETLAVTAAQAQTAMDRLVLVGSVTGTGVISSFSNRPGESCLIASGTSGCVSGLQWKNHFIVAPGENIYASLPGTSLGYMSGTSMATPIVSGVVALLQSRWPSLKADPAKTAQILFTSATDVGAAGVDGVYGHGLLNAARAFANSGVTTVSSPTGSMLQVDDRSLSASSVIDLTGVMSSVTAFDEFGRDYTLDQVSNFRLRQSRLPHMLQSAGQLLNLAGQSEWTSAFFAPKAQPNAWAGFGPQGATLRGGLGFDQSLRAGVDVPVAKGAMGLRLTGDSAARSDFAADAALTPLSFFASSDLLNRSALASFSTPTSKTGRLVMFGAVSGGTQISPEFYQPFASTMGYYDVTQDRGLQLERTPRRQAGFGVGWWKQPDERTVVGVAVSSFRQKHAFYDLSSDLDAFDEPTQVTNLGVAAMREYGKWNVFGAAEATSIKAPRSLGPIRFTDATLASGEVGLRRASLFTDGRHAQDNLSLSLALKPQALSGALRLSYFGRTADGLDLQPVERSIALSELTDRTLRVQSAYTVRQDGRWSFALTGGADVAGGDDVAVASQLNWTF